MIDKPTPLTYDDVYEVFYKLLKKCPAFSAGVYSGSLLEKNIDIIIPHGMG